MAPMSVPAASPGRPAARSLMGGHVRSASVPCQSQPLLMHVEDQLLALRSWTSNPGQNALSLAHVRALLCVLDELLHHHGLPINCTTTVDSLRLLDGFLVLADAFGSFLAALLALRQCAAELRAAVRRRDPAKMASAARAQRQVGKELEQLGKAARCAILPPQSSPDVVMRTVAEAINDTAVASASVFVQVAAVADAAAAMAAASPSSPPKRQMRLPLGTCRIKQLNRLAICDEDQIKDQAAALEKLELCIGELESESEKVFRSLVQTRVSLLNIHTPTF